MAGGSPSSHMNSPLKLILDSFLSKLRLHASFEWRVNHYFAHEFGCCNSNERANAEPWDIVPPSSPNGCFPPIPIIRIAAIVRYKVPFHIHRVSQLATGLRELSDRVGEV